MTWWPRSPIDQVRSLPLALIGVAGQPRSTSARTHWSSLGQPHHGWPSAVDSHPGQASADQPGDDRPFGLSRAAAFAALGRGLEVVAADTD
jgi:hypothetical protein